MKVIRAKVLGFCMGVRRAVDLALNTAAVMKHGLYCLGPLIHNAGVLKALEEKGIVFLKEDQLLEEESLKEEDGTVIIRAHGVPPLEEEKIARMGMHVLDATCPHVKLNQGKAAALAKKGCVVFLAGEENHGEIAAIKGYIEEADGKCLVVGNPDASETEARRLLSREPNANVALISQTTIRAEEYSAIEEKIRQFFPYLETVDSICRATKDRQEALRELCGKTEAIIIAGSQDSANTQRLLSLARGLGKPAWLVETPDNLPAEIKHYKTAGLSAGASSPDELIDEIEEALKAM